MIRTCMRCKYEWQQRGSAVPRQCPYCKSPKWAIRRDKQEVVQVVTARVPGAVVLPASAVESERHWEPVED